MNLLFNLRAIATLQFYLFKSYDNLKSKATSTEGLEKIAQKPLRQTAPEYLKQLYELMPHQMEGIINAQGGHTKYKDVYMQ